MTETIIYIILGVLQGFTEPLPISSSGHLEIAENLLNISLSTSFSAFINFGSTLAIILFFKDKITQLVIAFIYLVGVIIKGKKIKKYHSDVKLILKIIIATVPLVIAGISLKVVEFLTNKSLDTLSIKYIGLALIITALLLLIVKNKNGNISLSQMTYNQALLIGIAQAIALMPGISRSGATLVAALYIGIAKKDAFDFSFIMFIPASIGALLFGIMDMVGLDLKTTLFYCFSLLLATLFTWLSLLLTRKVVVSQKLYYFSIYCFIVGCLVVTLLK